MSGSAQRRVLGKHARAGSLFTGTLLNDYLRLFRQMREAEKLIDFAQFSSHRCIRAARSKHIEALFLKGMKETNQQEIVLHDARTTRPLALEKSVRTLNCSLMF